MPYVRKYSGPLRRGERSAYVKGTRVASVPAPPKALQKKSHKPNFKSSYKLTRPFRAVLDKHLKSKEEAHWATVAIKQQFLPPRPRHPNPAAQPQGIQLILPKITQVGVPIIAGGVQTDSLESREGSQVKLNSMSADIVLSLNPNYNPASDHASGIFYKIMICTCKVMPNYIDLIPNFFQGAGGALENQTFKDGADPVNWDKDMQNLSNPVNTNMFTVHASKSGFLTRGESTANTATNPPGVRMPLAFKRLNLKVNCKSKVLKFTQLDTIYPTNFQPFILFYYKAFDSYDYISQASTANFVEVSGKVHTSWSDMA